MNRTPKNKPEGSPEEGIAVDKLPKIMTKPLPEILDELESYIRRVEEAVKAAQSAARESKEAAAQAKISGEKAAEAAKKAADAAVAKVREEAVAAVNALSSRVAALEGNLDDLREMVIKEAAALDAAFLDMKNRHVADSPFLKKPAK